MTLYELINKLNDMVRDEPELLQKAVAIYIDDNEGYGHCHDASDVWFNHASNEIVIDNC